MTTSTVRSSALSSSLLSQLDSIVSEGRNPHTMHIDTLSTLDMLTLINNEDKKVALAVERTLPDIARAVDCISSQLAVGGRLIYIGAGTSGRLGILDAVECRPTFSVNDNTVIGIIAGGSAAIINAVEGAEDNTALAEQDLSNIAFNAKDVLVGIAASGRTPYVIGGIDYAKKIGAKTICVVCNPQSSMLSQVDIGIGANVGPECLTGSTRMKSGTAQKLILNMLSTASMIKRGKTFQNLMVDVSATNEKLNARAVRIVMQATNCNETMANTTLENANNNTKLAILMILTEVSALKGEEILLEHDGYLRHAIQATL